MRIYQVHTFVADQTKEGRLEHRRWASNQGAPVAGWGPPVGTVGIRASHRPASTTDRFEDIKSVRV